MSIISLHDDQKIAFARIISDLIEADFIIDEGEMDYFKEVISKQQLNIKNEFIRKARKMNLEEATNSIKKMREADRLQMLKLLTETSLSDGTCVPSEALLVLAIKLALENKAEIISVPSQGNHIETMKCIYIENEYDTDINGYISECLRSISNEFQLAGFEFVYIPQIVNNYKELDAEYLRNVISFMIPSYSDFKVQEIQEKLCSLTTSQFSKELLHEKMGLYLKDIKPSLFMKIGDSYIVKDNNDDEERNVISNYLCIPVEPRFLQQVRNLLDAYKKMVSKVNYIEVVPVIKKFKYSGFYKSLFNLIAFAPKISQDCYVLLDLYERTKPIKFIPEGESVNDTTERPGFKQKTVANLGNAIYAMIIVDTLKGYGSDWGGKYIRDGKFLDRLNVMYSPFSNGRVYMEGKTFSDFGGYEKKIRQMRDQKISSINSSLQSLASKVANISKFGIKSYKKGDVNYYRIENITPDNVLVRNRDGKIQRIEESAFWLF